MSTTIITRASKGGRLSFTDMDNNLLNLQATADAAAVKATVDSELALKANSADLSTVATSGSYSDLSGKPTNLSSFTNDSNFQTGTQVTTAIQAVVGAAPAALDTLAEIAAQLASDESAAAALVNTVSGKADIATTLSGYGITDAYTKSEITTSLAGKVDVVAGKGLSTEDYTSSEKTKLSGIEAGAQVNTVTSVASKTGAVTLTKSDVGLANVDNTTDLAKPVSSATQTALNLKANSADLATVATSGLFADLGSKPTTIAGYGITNAYTKTEVDSAISAATPTFSSLTGKPTTISGYGITDAYTKTQVDTSLAAKANSSSLATVATSGAYADLSGKPTAVSSFTNDSNYQTGAQVTSAIQAVVGAAPAALDTLAEIAAQLANDESAVSALTTVVSGKVAANSAITAGTGTKVTYDAKGLVTSSTTLSASDIPDLSATYQPLKSVLTSVGGLSTTSTGLVKLTNGVASFDTSAYLTGNQSITVSGDATGSGTTSIALTLASITDSGVGSFKKVTVNGKGLVTGTASVSQSDITGLLGAGSITNTMLANSAVANLSGTNTGDETAATIKTKLGISTLSGSNTGDQTITLTGDVTGSGTGSFAATLANSGVTAGTYTKVTVDAKGRATSGATLAAADIPDLSATYQPLKSILTSVGGLSTTSTGLVKLTNGVASFDTNTYLTGNQSITVSGDASGSGTTSITLTLANSGVTAGTYKSVTVDAKGRVTAGTNPTTLSGYGITDAVSSTLLGANSGVATLDSTGKLTAAQIPAALVGALQYKGTWNASTNSPALTSGTGTTGQYYKVATAGSTTIDGISQWNVGDMIVFDGTTWDKIDGLASEVTTVAGRVGAVTLSSSDISGLVASATTDTTNASNISSGTLAAARLPAFSGDATSTAGSSVLTLANSGVTAGTYKSVTVNAKGIITAGTNPTTLSGYGITDAAALSGATFTGDVTAPNFNTNSDRTLKTNIVKIESASEIVSKLEGVSYNWKDSGEKAFGFIAQDIQEVLPELVGKNEALDTLTVNYQGVIPFLVEAIKEQAARIAELESKLNK